MDEEEDTLSLLPDCLILEIISRLTYTKEVVRTGILSKRWKHLWTQVPNLVFHRPYNCNENKDSQSLIDFYSYVDKTLTQCRHLNLNKFKLNTRYDIQFESQVNKWICYALNCNVQELDLLLKIPRYEGGFVLDSESFFINSCLTKLKFFDCLFNPSGTIRWKNLRSLSITYGKLNEGLIQNILFGSPVLETFKLYDCYGYKRIDITSKSLKNLVFSGYNNPESRSKSKYDIIEINAPNIWSLTVRKCLVLSNLFLVNVSCLVKAKLDYTKSKNNDTTHEQVEEEMLKGFILKLCHVKELTIGDSCQKVLSRLKAKNFTFPSNLRSEMLPHLDTDD